MPSKSPRSLRVAPEFIPQVKQAQNLYYHRQQDLADEIPVALCTVSKFLNGKPVEHTYFVELSDKLRQDWQKIAYKDTPPEPNFVGREGAIADLNTLVSAGAKVIGIYGKGGVGKTTLAHQYFKMQGFNILTLSIMETEDITPVEEWIGHWLRRDFKEEPESKFCLMLDQLKHKLQTQRIGVLIDNLEPALDANGKFITAYRRYVELLKVLAAPDVKSMTLITSRDCLHEISVNVQPYTANCR